ncbi:MAG TPA: hypothetical protein PK669_00520 [Methanosarcina thermophila]|uniref:Uncharacterized protein n=2 Tax=Methanosarcina thermophila TaxID=2210 RepID=A0A3G9CVQ9_METTE|nr:hypothetical protein [Methanosarcina thermophila]BAW30388.1 conserved hypothetical protein [Methanosarcina thermophila]HOA68838.1 hypothetical protein [Methanosarcina thermophila]HOQ64852.1 hypothetical protein [Methanosarcina thermophila]HPT80931.1 hypothetical protein [Methanosarcina thermophila]HPZ18786.1 hypothetical protein [Methanosarcina thermophila]
MTYINLYDDFLYHDKTCKITKEELNELFPQYKERWDELLGDSNGWRRIKIVTAAFADIGEEGGISMLVTPTIDGEFPVKTEETFEEQAQKYDKIVGSVHEFGTCKSDLSEECKYPLAQMYVADPDAKIEKFNEFKLKYGTVEEKREIIKEIEREKEIGTYYSLDLGIWEPVKMDRGEYKGMDPVVTSQGNVAVGRKYAGQSVKVFVRKQ